VTERLEVPGARATLVLFSSAFCAPCRATRSVLGRVADMLDGVALREVDAEASLDVVRRLGVESTPTTLVLDAGGSVVARRTGQPRAADVIAAVAPLLAPARTGKAPR
jgi:thioredoxin-like negative regulator of GroEL